MKRKMKMTRVKIVLRSRLLTMKIMNMIASTSTSQMRDRSRPLIYDSSKCQCRTIKNRAWTKVRVYTRRRLMGARLHDSCFQKRDRSSSRCPMGVAEAEVEAGSVRSDRVDNSSRRILRSEHASMTT